MKTRKVYYKRYQNTTLHHLCPAPGYNCPRIPLGGVGNKQPDYELVRVVKTEGDCAGLKGRRVMISWGLNITVSKAAKLHQVLAIDRDGHHSSAEIVLAC